MKGIPELLAGDMIHTAGIEALRAERSLASDHHHWYFFGKSRESSAADEKDKRLPT